MSKQWLMSQNKDINRDIQTVVCISRLLLAWVYPIKHFDCSIDYTEYI